MDVENPSAALLLLAERCEKAEGGSLDLTADIYETLGYDVIRAPRRSGGISWRYRGKGGLDRLYHDRWQVQEPLSQSLDAAKRVLPERAAWDVGNDGYEGVAAVDCRRHDGSFIHGACFTVHAATPELALCAAALRARAALISTGGQ